MELRQYKAEDAIEIIKARAKQPTVELSEQAEQWAKLKETRGPAVTCVADGRIIGCGGLEIVWEGMAEAWLLFVHDIGNYPMLPRLAKRTLNKWIEECKLIRVQAPMRVDFPEGLRLAEWLGFECEGRLRKYQPDGSDGLMHSIIIER